MNTPGAVEFTVVPTAPFKLVVRAADGQLYDVLVRLAPSEVVDTGGKVTTASGATVPHLMFTAQLIVGVSTHVETESTAMPPVLVKGSSSAN